MAAAPYHRHPRTSVRPFGQEGVSMIRARLSQLAIMLAVTAPLCAHAALPTAPMNSAITIPTAVASPAPVANPATKPNPTKLRALIHLSQAATPDADGDLFHPNGHIAFCKASGNWYHDNGKYAYYGATGNAYHANGKHAYYAETGNWYHDNGVQMFHADT